MNLLQVEQNQFLNLIVNLIPGNVFCKDIQGRYFFANTNCIKSVGLNSHDAFYGKTTYEIMEKKYAEIVIENDDLVISQEKEITTIEEGLRGTKKPGVYLSKKTPMYNEEKKVIGMFGIAIDITEQTNISDKMALLESFNNHTTIADENIPKLSQRQIECLYYYSRGASAKQIAKLIGLSPRTVESYIEAIKIKFNCNSKFELLNKVLKTDYINTYRSIHDKNILVTQMKHEIIREDLDDS